MMRHANDNRAHAEARHSPADRGALVVYVARERYAGTARRRLQRYRDR